jgi:hypothetical protein
MNLDRLGIDPEVVKAAALRQLQRDQDASGASGAPRSSGADPDADHGLNASDDHAMRRHNGLFGSDKRIAGDVQKGEEYQQGLSRMEGNSAPTRDRGTPGPQRGLRDLASAGPDWGRMPDPGRSRRGARGDGATLAEFCRDLVAEARAGRLNPVSGSSEVKDVACILGCTVWDMHGMSTPPPPLMPIIPPQESPGMWLACSPS